MCDSIKRKLEGESLIGEIGSQKDWFFWDFQPKMYDNEESFSR